MPSAIAVENLVKTYQAKESSKNFFKGIFAPQYTTVTAVDHVSLDIKQGEIFGLLGTNGAGKTTLIKCLTGLMTPNSGSIYLNNKSIEESKHHLGAMFSSNMIYNRITGYDNLKFFAKLYGVKDYEKRIAELAKTFDITKYLPRLVEGYSLGTKTRLAFARTLLHDPDILFLDEPTLGLDPYIGANIRKVIKELDKTILLTTHYMEDADELCDRIGILHQGKIIATGTPEQLKKMVKSHTSIVIESSYPSPQLQAELKKAPFVLAFYKREQGLKILIDHKNDLSKLLKILARYKLTKIDEHEPSLEDVFIKLTEAQHAD
jgi:ABC-2 type transport system ATP-binding protein